MDGDEVFALLAAAVLAIAAAIRWYGPLVRLPRFGSGRGRRAVLALTPILLIVMLQTSLRRWAAHEVREDPQYDILFLVAGAAWLGSTSWALPLVGFSARDDVMESRNGAALLAVSAALAGSMFCYIGGNIGEGPTIWTTFGPAALATVSLFALWLILEIIASPRIAITIERDPATAWRLAGFLVACGLILGRAVAGDWQSWDDTVSDFAHQAWPAGLVLLVTCHFQWLWRSDPKRSRHSLLSAGLLPAFGLLAIAIADLASLGWPGQGR